jgi:hypothetical protein
MLEWRREQDGEHDGKPVYEYKAISDNRRYCIVWSCDRRFQLVLFANVPVNKCRRE